MLLNDMCGLLMRFCLHNIGLVSDIEKAFLQVGPQPNEQDVTRSLKEAESIHVKMPHIWCRDFNLVLNPQLDYKNYKTILNTTAREKSLDIINEEHLVDPYRDAHPELQRYTWRKQHYNIQELISF